MIVDDTWVRTGMLTTVSLTQSPGASPVGDELDDWLADAALAAIVVGSPWNLEAAITVMAVLEPPPDHATWRNLVVQVVFPPDATSIEELVTHVQRSVAALVLPTAWQATIEVATLPLSPDALAAFVAGAKRWWYSEGLRP